MRKNLTKTLNIKASGHKDIDFVDVSLVSDTKLFIDPCLIETDNSKWSQNACKTMNGFFDVLYSNFTPPTNYSNLYELFQHSRERNEARLGYGNGDNGKGNTAAGMIKILADVPHLIESGIKMTAPIDLPLFVVGFAEDGMSDMLINVLYKELTEFTVQQ